MGTNHLAHLTAKTARSRRTPTRSIKAIGHTAEFEAKHKASGDTSKYAAKRKASGHTAKENAISNAKRKASGQRRRRKDNAKNNAKM